MMKCNIERKELVKGISKLQGVVDKNGHTPILGSILIVARGTTEVTLFGTNMEESLHIPCPAEIVEVGRIAVDARKFYEIVKELPDGPVSLSLLENQSVQVLSGKSKFKLQAFNPDDYPVQTEVKEEFGFDMPSESFTEMIKKTAFAIGENDTRYVLNGMLLFYRANDKGASVRFVGTDGHRLAVSACAVTPAGVQDPASTPAFEKKVIVPKKAVLELKKLVSEAEIDTLHIGYGQNQVMVTIGSIRFSARLMEGTYPDYAKIIPAEFLRNATFRREDLTRSIRRVSLLCNEKLKAVKMAIDEEKAVLSVQSTESGEAEDELPVDFAGAKLEAGFNARYLLDTLSAINHEEIKVEFRDGLSPTAFKDPSDPNFLCIVMPMRV